MKRSQNLQAAWHQWLSFSAFTLGGVAFEGARFGVVVTPVATVAKAKTWRAAEEIKEKD
ncbi:hypothetical protein [Pantoea sp. USHLN298]|uniref:hypothetical protein n=1 Tax=Pantoea sp. USHLN298 TaxID=3081294 RepID=UPI003016E895